MADEQHLALLNQGVDVWNSWRGKNPALVPNLSRADLRGANLSGRNLYEAQLYEANLSGANLSGVYLNQANLRGANLSGANLSGANLSRANLSGANLSGANLVTNSSRRVSLSRADLSRADLSRADLRGANLSEANLYDAQLYEANLSGANLFRANLHAANLSGANLSGAELYVANLYEANLSGAELRGANLTSATLVQTNFSEANLDGCFIYGISAWGVNSEGASQSNLVITPPSEPIITVDNLEVAQFVYLLLNNQKIRDVINTITSKAVLILGRFTLERKAVLDALREELRKRDFLPILFDFDKPSSRNLTETVSTLAHIVRFIIADITDAKSIPQELQRIVPDLPSLPVQPIILSSQDEYGMFTDFRGYPWVLPPYRYDSLEGLLAVLEEKVIDPAVHKAEEIEEQRKAVEEEIAKR